MNKNSSKPIAISPEASSTPQHEMLRDISFSALYKDMFSLQPSPSVKMQGQREKQEERVLPRPLRLKSKSPNRLQFREVKAKKFIPENRSASILPKNKPSLVSFKRNQFVNCVINVNKPGKPVKPLAFSTIYGSVRKTRLK